MYIMCVCLFSALSRRVGALQMSNIIIIQVVFTGHLLMFCIAYLKQRFFYDCLCVFLACIPCVYSSCFRTLAVSFISDYFFLNKGKKKEHPPKKKKRKTTTTAHLGDCRAEKVAGAARAGCVRRDLLTLDPRQQACMQVAARFRLSQRIASSDWRVPSLKIGRISYCSCRAMLKN